MRVRRSFTLVELLVVVSIIGLLIAILVPSLAKARAQSRTVVCMHNVHVLGQGLGMYASSNNDLLLPSRLPKIDECNSYAEINGGRKYRPTFLAVMGTSVGVPAFEDPQPCKADIDRYGEAGDRQDYYHPTYLCSAVPSWTDERNGAYGYNYQFLGNSRLRDSNVLDSYKNWAVPLAQIRHTASTVAMADCMGTAASWAPRKRADYENNSRDADRLGNEGFNLDPPRVDPTDGEMANFDKTPQSRTAVDPRHQGRAGVLWLDAHADTQTPEQLGYRKNPDGSFGFEGNNTFWSGTGRDVAWTLTSSP
ncbi:MAG: prepilin-type N-terminal cleavage/methylation domain-containing protein [bacterium]|nr:prepilin-type N-terminal cleavage/methylation domain-containing protein [bacterium]